MTHIGQKLAFRHIGSLRGHGGRFQFRGAKGNQTFQFQLRISQHAVPRFYFGQHRIKTFY